MCVAAPDVDWPNLEEYQCCQDCGSAEATRYCPVYRCLKNQGCDHSGQSFVKNKCAHKPCGKPLCEQHLCPAGRSNRDTRLRFCEDCAKGRAHSTGCGVGGIDIYSQMNKETHGKGPYQHKAISLWPCRPSEGCFNTLCRKCGAAYDGCSLHQRQHPCSMWYEHWGPRYWGGHLGGEARLVKLTALQLAHMQEHQLLAICDVPRACHTEEAAAFEAAADELHYEPGLLPSPVMMPNGNTMYPG